MDKSLEKRLEAVEEDISLLFQMTNAKNLLFSLAREVLALQKENETLLGQVEYLKTVEEKYVSIVKQDTDHSLIMGSVLLNFALEMDSKKKPVS